MCQIDTEAELCQLLSLCRAALGSERERDCIFAELELEAGLYLYTRRVLFEQYHTTVAATGFPPSIKPQIALFVPPGELFFPFASSISFLTPLTSP